MRKFLIILLVVVFAFSGCSNKPNEKNAFTDLLRAIDYLYLAERDFVNAVNVYKNGGDGNVFRAFMDDFQFRIDDLEAVALGYMVEKGVLEEQYEIYKNEFQPKLIEYRQYVKRLEEDLNEGKEVSLQEVHDEVVLFQQELRSVHSRILDSLMGFYNTGLLSEQY